MSTQIELRTEIPNALTEPLESWFFELDLSPWGLMQKEQGDPYHLFGYFPDDQAADAALAELRAAFPELPETFERTEIVDEHWQTAYKEFVKPWQDRSLHWIPLWERDTFPAPAEGTATVYLDAGMAFGTGSHETTRLCARRLLDYLETHGEVAKGKAVIDAGCGSGVLAFSAAALGFSRIEAFDFDPEAIEVCHANAGENPHLPAVDFAVADLEEGLGGRSADLLLANIQTDVLIPFADAIIQALAPGATLALSGILATERETVMEHFALRCEALGRAVAKTDSRTDGEWVDLQIVLAD